ncbi:MAG: LPD29 domain-containing protein [bacterium]|nr:LPD29 domain-containing protein [bacterium]
MEENHKFGCCCRNCSNNFTGEKYERCIDISEIAKKVRKEIKEKFPNIKTSVRISRFSGGQSLDVDITGCDFNPVNPEWDSVDYSYPSKQIYTDEGLQLLKNIKKIVNQYNFDYSKIEVDYFHVNFYGHVKFDYDFKTKCIETLKNNVIITEVKQ